MGGMTMIRRISASASAGLLVAGLLITVPRGASASVIFDDDFTGNSGGIPAGWSIALGTGSIVEAGTTVAMEAVEDLAIASDAVIDPSGGTVTIQTDIAGMAGQVAAGLTVPDQFPIVFFISAIRGTDGRVEVTAADSEGGAHVYDLAYLVGYTGGPIRLTTTLGSTWFSVSTDAPAFSSGPIAYATAFATFDRDDLGTATSVVLMDYDDPGASIIDRVLVNVEGTTAGQTTTFGRIKALYRR
jgi:hypothetical protein